MLDEKSVSKPDGEDGAKTATHGSRLQLHRLQPAIGAEIHGLDLREPLTQEDTLFLKAALLAHGVIFLPHQEIDEAGFTALGRVFGVIEEDKVGEPGQEGRNGKLKLLRSNAGTTDQSASVWHSDGCYMAIPPTITMLRALQASPFGGDTCFSSAVAAYQNLPDDLKERIKPLRYRSSFEFVISRYGRFSDPADLHERAKHMPPVDQPVVRVHPETGAHVLYVNDSQTIDIIGLEPEESAALLHRLTDEIKRPEFQTRWKWRNGDIAIWDNRAVQHYGVPDQMGDRVMQRLTVLGTEAAIAA